MERERERVRVVQFFDQRLIRRSDEYATNERGRCKRFDLAKPSQASFKVVLKTT